MLDEKANVAQERVACEERYGGFLLHTVICCLTMHILLKSRSSSIIPLQLLTFPCIHATVISVHVHLH